MAAPLSDSGGSVGLELAAQADAAFLVNSLKVKSAQRQTPANFAFLGSEAGPFHNMLIGSTALVVLR